MHANTDSEATSLSASSPARSPSRRGPVYYVQSPSRDSHDGEKTSASFHSTPVLSPSASPHHSSIGHHSRESSSTRFSGSLKPGSRKIAPNDGKGHKKCDVIEEEGLLEEDDYQKPLPRRCYFLAFVLGFFVLFTFFSLILWAAARSQKPKIEIKSVKFERFLVSSGSDPTGVATEMASVNYTLKFLYRNTATFNLRIYALLNCFTFMRCSVAQPNSSQNCLTFMRCSIAELALGTGHPLYREIIYWS